MPYSEFVKMYAADVKSTPDFLLSQRPLSFPISSNERGKGLTEFFQRSVNLDLRGKRVLDVGCAYGGLSIALAEAGAVVSGIDVSSKFIQYAQANAADTVDIDFHVVDASGVGLRKLFQPKSFDLIVLNDVLEHIYDTASLAANLNWLLNDTGSIYFKVPNGHSPRFALSEGHRKIFGLTLLDPDCWFYLYPKRASIFYRPISHFAGIFSHFGISDMLLIDEEEVFRRFTPRKLKLAIKEIYEKAREYEYPDPNVKVYIRQGITKFRDGYDYDLAEHGDDFVKFKYGSYFFTGFASRPGSGLAARSAVRSLPEVGRIAAKSPASGMVN